MNDTNYIGGVVKILEIPKQKTMNNDIAVLTIRVQFLQFRNTKVTTLTLWGNLAYDVVKYYQVDDYILIEGYLSLQNKKLSQFIRKNSKIVNISVVKIYPIFLAQIT